MISLLLVLRCSVNTLSEAITKFERFEDFSHQSLVGVSTVKSISYVLNLCLLDSPLSISVADFSHYKNN